MNTKLEFQLDSYAGLLSGIDSSRQITTYNNQLQLCFKGLLDAQQMRAYMEAGGSAHAVSELYNMRLYGYIPSVEGFDSIIGKAIQFIRELIERYLNLVSGCWQPNAKRCTRLLAKWKENQVDIFALARTGVRRESVDNTSPPNIQLYVEKVFTNGSYVAKQINGQLGAQLDAIKGRLNGNLSNSELSGVVESFSDLMAKTFQAADKQVPGNQIIGPFRRKLVNWPKDGDREGLVQLIIAGNAMLEEMNRVIPRYNTVADVLKSVKGLVSKMDNSDKERCMVVRKLLERIGKFIKLFNYCINGYLYAAEYNYSRITGILRTVFTLPS